MLANISADKRDLAKDRGNDGAENKGAKERDQGRENRIHMIENGTDKRRFQKGQMEQINAKCAFGKRQNKPAKGLMLFKEGTLGIFVFGKEAEDRNSQKERKKPKTIGKVAKGHAFASRLKGAYNYVDHDADREQDRKKGVNFFGESILHQIVTKDKITNIAADQRKVKVV